MNHLVEPFNPKNAFKTIKFPHQYPWSLLFFCLNLTIFYYPGSKNLKPDLLFRQYHADDSFEQTSSVFLCCSPLQGPGPHLSGSFPKWWGCTHLVVCSSEHGLSTMDMRLSFPVILEPTAIFFFYAVVSGGCLLTKRGWCWNKTSDKPPAELLQALSNVQLIPYVNIHQIKTHIHQFSLWSGLNLTKPLLF